MNTQEQSTVSVQQDHSLITIKSTNKYKGLARLKQPKPEPIKQTPQKLPTQQPSPQKEVQVYQSTMHKQMSETEIAKRIKKRSQRVNIILSEEQNEIKNLVTKHPPGHISQLPFEMYLIMVQYCGAEDSFNLIGINKEIRSFVLASKLIIYRQLFCRSQGMVMDKQVQQYFKIMESAGSKDLFVFYELLIWGIKENKLSFIQEQIDNCFPKILQECLVNQRTLDRFIAFYAQQMAEILQKIFDKLKNDLAQDPAFQLNREQMDQLFEYLLNKRRKYDGNTLAHLAVKYEQDSILEYLIGTQSRWQFDVKTKNKDGHAIIHLAVKQKNEKLFNIIGSHQHQLVLPVGIQYIYPTSACINMYEDTITLAAQSGLLDLFKRLIYSVNSNVHTLNVKKAMLYACEYNHMDLVKFLINFGFDLNQNLVRKKSPLYVACEFGHLELACYLIQRFEIDPNIQCEDSNKTALYRAAEKGYSQIVEELIKRPDIDVNKTTSGKKTALYVAIEKNHVECVRQILKKCSGDDLYKQTSFGTTPLFAAQRKANKDIIKLMMCVGRKPNPNYEQNLASQPTTESGKELLIVNELPRFLQDVKTLRELNPSEFNGGVVNKNFNVQSRYMEGVSVPKKPKEEEVHIKQIPKRSQSQNPKLSQPRQRPQTSKPRRQARLSDEEEKGEDFYLSEEEYGEEEEKTIKKPKQVDSSIINKPLKFKYDITQKKLYEEKSKSKMLLEPIQEPYVNPAMSKVKSRLFDFLSTKKEEEKQPDKLTSTAKPPINPQRLMDLSKPKKKLDIRDCFVKQKSLNMIVFADPNYYQEPVAENTNSAVKILDQDKSIISAKKKLKKITGANIKSQSFSRDRSQKRPSTAAQQQSRMFQISTKTNKVKHFLYDKTKTQQPNSDLQELISPANNQSTIDDQPTESNSEQMDYNEKYSQSMSRFQQADSKLQSFQERFYRSDLDLMCQSVVNDKTKQKLEEDSMYSEDQDEEEYFEREEVIGDEQILEDPFAKLKQKIGTTLIQSPEIRKTTDQLLNSEVIICSEVVKYEQITIENQVSNEIRENLKQNKTKMTINALEAAQIMDCLQVTQVESPSKSFSVPDAFDLTQPIRQSLDFDIEASIENLANFYNKQLKSPQRISPQKTKFLKLSPQFPNVNDNFELEQDDVSQIDEDYDFDFDDDNAIVIDSL